MLLFFLTLINFCFPTPSSSIPQVVPWGFQNSIGKSLFNPPWYDVENVTEGIFAADDYYNWPNNTVPYEFDYNATNLNGNITLLNENIATALINMQIIMNTTCVRFVPHTNETNYLFITFGDGCWSGVGYRHTPKQSMGGVCGTHEFLHALGFVHEQSRRDRDYYTAFNWTNLDPAYYETYEIKNWPVYGTALDPLSTMMYMGWYGHIDDNYPVSIYKDGTDGNNGFIHDFKIFSENDRQKVNRRYKCDPQDSCWDEDIFNCPVWAAAGGCQDSSWVMTVCKNLCVDIQPDFCSIMSFAMGDTFCKDVQFAKDNCKASCNAFPKTNQRSDCGYIGATLGNSNDPAVGGMGKFCRKSCGFCKRPDNYTLNPMIITKCTRTCNPACIQNNGCNLSLPPNNPDYDQTKPISQCKSLPAKNGLTTAEWCATSKWAQYYCQTTCNIRQTCHPLCVDQDQNCPNLAAKKGCFSLYE